MSLSQRHLDRRTAVRTLDFDRLAAALQSSSPDIVFAVVLGSGVTGVLPPGSDLDLALWIAEPSRALEALLAAIKAVESLLPDVRPDVGVLNRADPVYRFAAAGGRLLFTRDLEVWLDFFSRAAREYEYQLADYDRQRRYRLEALQNAD